MWQKMNIHTEEGFKSFMEELLETNATLGFYCDFEKIKRNVRGVEISLNTLNYLIGKQDLVKAIKELWEWDKSVFEVLPILIAVRKRDNKKVLGLDGKIACVNDYCMSLSTGADLCHNGQKLIGSAQYRHHNYILQHGSILFGYNKDVIEKIFNEKTPENTITCIKEINADLTRKDIVEALKQGFKEYFTFYFC